MARAEAGPYEGHPNRAKLDKYWAVMCEHWDAYKAKCIAIRTHTTEDRLMSMCDTEVLTRLSEVQSLLREARVIRKKFTRAADQHTHFGGDAMDVYNFDPELPRRN